MDNTEQQSPPRVISSNPKYPPSRTAGLRPIQLGKSGNPKGRKPSNLTKKDKLQLLSEMARMNLKKANPVEAIKEHNRMEGIYGGEVKQQTINILVMSEEAREITKQILGGIRTEKALQGLTEGGLNGSNSGKEEGISTKLHEEEEGGRSNKEV